jgi:hypothetical protein
MEFFLLLGAAAAPGEGLDPAALAAAITGGVCEP